MMVHLCGRFQPEAVLIFSREFVSNHVVKEEGDQEVGAEGVPTVIVPHLHSSVK